MRDFFAVDNGEYRSFTGHIITRNTDGGVENANFSIVDGCLIFRSGTWIDGAVDNCVFCVGTIWKNGYMRHGDFSGCLWENGTFEDSMWYGEYWRNGVFINSFWQDGTWEKGTWVSGVWGGGVRLSNEKKIVS